jgi:hypothetical protein
MNVVVYIEIDHEPLPSSTYLPFMIIFPAHSALQAVQMNTTIEESQ